eukprot:COSAG06_NODE_43922_length_367_cov_10.343284_1_plen_76_part_00
MPKKTTRRRACEGARPVSASRRSERVPVQAREEALRTASGRPPPPVMTPFGGANGVLRPWSERGTVRRSSTSASR